MAPFPADCVVTTVDGTGTYRADASGYDRISCGAPKTLRPLL
ncbi:hypothetical protein ABT404_04050 [Streptomyces hyaluromycini]|uniref:Uncharacterized protein n=1 Tax=Streptomyces hyaluromycini TaxID=1377993 RepID=A0ABV1WQQ7_9ACTN